MTDHADRSASPEAAMLAAWDDAHDFDPKDPLAGLARHELSGPQMSRRTVLRLMAAAGTLTAAHLLPRGPALAQGKAGGTLKCGWAGVGQITTLDPAKMNQVLQFQITSNVLSGLTHISAELIAEADLARDWQVSEDGTEYTFNLREGVTFHNGEPFTADDVLFTYARSKNPAVSIHSRALGNVAGVEKLGAHKVKFKLNGPQASFLVKTTERSSGRVLTILNKTAIEKMGEAAHGLAPVGTGPFRIAQHTLAQSLTMERFDRYYDPERPKLDRVVIQPILDAEPLAAAIEAGDIQLIGGGQIAPELVDRLVANKDLVVNIQPSPGFESIWMNPHREPFRVASFDKPVEELMKEKGFMVRLAIAKALDRTLFIRQAEFGRGTPAHGSVNPAMAYYFDKELAGTSLQRFDLAEAKRLMAAAGYPDGKGFPRLKVLLTPPMRRQVEVIRAILKRNLGIELEPVVKDVPVALDEFATMEWDMVRIGSGGDYDPDDAIVDWMQTSSLFNGQKRDKAKYPFGYFSEKEADALIEQQRIEGNLEKRRALVRKADKVTSDKVASAFLYHPATILIHRKSVNFPAASKIPALVDLDRTTLA
ncbi:ABC transporter substrate-binding protein [Stella sp.]|uniref:ABC transporter substrate-binding protein n=1 Tax=Stella sp. TaxID=2912054 RepID=UPI0035B3D67B